MIDYCSYTAAELVKVQFLYTGEVVALLRGSLQIGEFLDRLPPGRRDNLAGVLFLRRASWAQVKLLLQKLLLRRILGTLCLQAVRKK